MRLLAALIVLVLVTLPLVACGVSASIEGCQGECDTCSSSADCCHGVACTLFTRDGQGRCSNYTFACKLGN